MTNQEFKELKDGTVSYITTTELKAADERVESYHNGWIDGREDLKKQVIKLIMADYTKYSEACDYVNRLLNKIDKI